MDIINNLTVRLPGEHESLLVTAASLCRAEYRGAIDGVPPLVAASCLPRIGKTQFWGRAARALSEWLTSRRPIGPPGTLSICYWFIDLPRPPNFGRTTDWPRSWPCEPLLLDPSSLWAAPRQPETLSKYSQSVATGQWHCFSPKMTERCLETPGQTASATKDRHILRETHLKLPASSFIVCLSLD